MLLTVGIVADAFRAEINSVWFTDDSLSRGLGRLRWERSKSVVELCPDMLCPDMLCLDMLCLDMLCPEPAA